MHRGAVVAELTVEPCKTLAEALAVLQGRLPRVAKTGDGQYGKYADLTVVSEALRPLMATLDLAFIASYQTIQRQYGGMP